MRFLFPALALSIAALSIYVDRAGSAVASPVCKLGLCRFDQLYASVDREGAAPQNLAGLIRQDPSNPSAWCTYAESLASRGDLAGAQAAFARAAALGPGMSPVLMRIANFDFTHGRTDDAFAVSKQILRQTGAFDEAIFSYLERTRIPAAELMERVLPLELRAAGAWLKWQEENGAGENVVDAARWMRAHGLETKDVALNATGALWGQQDYRSAQQLWADWLGSNGIPWEAPFNPAFQAAPNGSPFDWSLNGTDSVELKRENGLEVRFAPNDRTTFSGVHQFLALAPGRYRLSADVEAHDLAGQQVMFHVLDVDPHRKVDVQGKPLSSDTPRATMNLEFAVPDGTQAVELELVRYAAPPDDNGAKPGAVHVYRLGVERLP